MKGEPMCAAGVRARLSLAVALMVVSSVWAQSTHIEKALGELEQSPPVSPDAFDFIVVADSNTLKPLENSDIYTQSLAEFNLLKPHFVVHTGDIILGGAAEGVPPQWDLWEQTVAVCEPPYLVLPGNHDITDQATEDIWTTRIGPTHYSFRYGNSFFILLNSEEQGAVERISDAQVAWLKEQLESAKAENVFVFLHQPYFEHSADPALAEEEWEERWANVAETFKGYPVRVVFAGHRHIYRDCGTVDGVRYVINGGASVYGKGAGEAEGGFNHYLRVSVRGSEVSWAVIKPFSILPENVVTSARIDELYNIRNTWIVADEIAVPLGESVDRDVKVVVQNPHEKVLNSSIAWETTPGWTITPMTIDYEVAPNGSTTLTFRVQAARPEDARFPVPLFRTRYDLTLHGPAVDVEQDLRFVPELSAARAKGAIALDGVLDEWGAAQMMPMVYPVDFDGKDPADLSASMGFMWDDDFVYLAVETTDNEHTQPFAGDIVWSADNVEMFLGDWSWGLTLTAGGPEVFLYRGVDVSAETVNTDVKLGVKRDGTKITYEAAFPKSHLTPLALAVGESFRYNALMNDLDASGPVEERHWLQLVPERGTRGSRPPRVKVVLQE